MTRPDGVDVGLRELGERRPFPREALAVHARDAARALLGALVVRDLDGHEVVARVVETEAYREDDPASHSHAGRTARSEPMFWRPGTAYVYRSYGVHWCANVAVEAPEVGAAVLLRAAVVLRGAPLVGQRRPTVRSPRELLRGPGNLTRGLAIDAPTHDRGDLIEGVGGLRLQTDGWGPPPAAVRWGPRVGVSRAAERPWRAWVADTPEVSRYVRSPRALAPMDDPTGR